MYEVSSLIKRNIKNYLRDPMSVFFSFLSVIILMMIYILFLGDIGGDGLKDILSDKEMRFLIYSQMMAGVLVLNTLTIPLGNLGNVVVDFEQHQIDAFVVTPVKRYKIILGYYISSLLITLVFSLLMWWLAIVVLGLVTGIYFSFAIAVQISLWIVLFVLISTSIMVFLVTFIKSINAFGAVSGIFGSLIGFISGIYMPLTSSSPDFLKGLASVVPFTHMVTSLKQVLMQPSFDLIAERIGDPAISSDVISQVRDGFGANSVGFLGLSVEPYVMIIVAVVLGIGFMILSTIRLSKRINQ